jgi:hypothetical protein
MKRKLTLSIDEETLNQAKISGINLSSFLETRLVDYMTRKIDCSLRDSNPSSWLDNLLGLTIDKA